MINKQYAKKYIKYMDNKKNKNKTWDDFFNHIGVAKKLRSNFLVACILKQAQEIIEGEKCHAGIS